MPRTFFYFIPDRHTLTPTEAEQLGLAYAFDSGIDTHQVERGPEGLRGIICAQQDSYDDGQLGYHAERQVWREMPQPPGSSPQHRLFVGHYKDAAPGPEDLERKKRLGGVWLDLDDGRAWLCPLARCYSEKSGEDEASVFFYVNLPQRLDLAADGRWTPSGVTSRYAALWELSEAWQSVRDGQAGDAVRSRFDYQGQIDGALLCLQANYRVGRLEAALLGLFTDSLTVKILDTLIDVETFAELIKKKASRSLATASTSPATPLSSAGPAASTGTTGPPAPT